MARDYIQCNKGAEQRRIQVYPENFINAGRRLILAARSTVAEFRFLVSATVGQPAQQGNDHAQDTRFGVAR